jgi:hypothetical protein
MCPPLLRRYSAPAGARLIRERFVPFCNERFNAIAFDRDVCSRDHIEVPAIKGRTSFAIAIARNGSGAPRKLDPRPHACCKKGTAKAFVAKCVLIALSRPHRLN